MLTNNRGVTLLELLVTLMILSMILTVAVKAWDVTLERGRFQTTTRKLNTLRDVIVGDERIVINGQRVDFGFVGDMGRLPNNLRELVELPVGLPDDSGNWRGPYITAGFQAASSEGFRIDGWGDTIFYNRESLYLRSTGGRGLIERDRWIVKEFGYADDQLTKNRVTVQVLDVRGLPPPVELIARKRARFERATRLFYPVAGVLDTNGIPPPVPMDNNGQFYWQLVPQGRHQLRVVYIRDDFPVDTVTTYREVVVYPGTDATDLQVRLDVDWRLEPVN